MKIVQKLAVSAVAVSVAVLGMGQISRLNPNLGVNLNVFEKAEAVVFYTDGELSANRLINIFRQLCAQSPAACQALGLNEAYYANVTNGVEHSTAIEFFFTNLELRSPAVFTTVINGIGEVASQQVDKANLDLSEHSLEYLENARDTSANPQLKALYDGVLKLGTTVFNINKARYSLAEKVAEAKKVDTSNKTPESVAVLEEKIKFAEDKLAEIQAAVTANGARGLNALDATFEDEIQAAIDGLVEIKKEEAKPIEKAPEVTDKQEEKKELPANVPQAPNTGVQRQENNGIIFQIIALAVVAISVPAIVFFVIKKKKARK